MKWREFIKSKYFRMSVISFVVISAIFYGILLISGIKLSFFRFLSQVLLLWIMFSAVFYIMRQRAGKVPAFKNSFTGQFKKGFKFGFLWGGLIGLFSG